MTTEGDLRVADTALETMSKLQCLPPGQMSVPQRSTSAHSNCTSLTPCPTLIERYAYPPRRYIFCSQYPHRFWHVARMTVPRLEDGNGLGVYRQAMTGPYRVSITTILFLWTIFGL